MLIGERIKIIRENAGLSQEKFAESVGLKRTNIAQIELGKQLPTIKIISEIVRIYNTTYGYLIDGNDKIHSESIKTDNKEKEIVTHLPKQIVEETRPRIPLNAKAGSLSVALDGITLEKVEQLPILKAFPKYDFTIFANGDSMESELHSGDELVCLLIRNSSFIQWGKMHILDTSQGIIVKRIFDAGEYILCRSEESDLYPDFNIHKTEIYNIALIIGLIRRY